jgi:VWFA-related protein
MTAVTRHAASVLLAAAGAAAVWASGPARLAAQQVPAPTFRGGVNIVSVDVIVTDDAGNPITNLTREDFEIVEDGVPQVIEQFRPIDLGGSPVADDRPLPAIGTREVEETEAARPDARLIAFFLSDYQVCWERQAEVRETLARFIRTGLRRGDLVAVFDPLVPVGAVLFTYDHEAVARAVAGFEARKGDYTPRNDMETEQWLVANRMAENQGAFVRQMEEIRAAVVRDALKALAVRLGSTREGRKSVVFVSEGFPPGFATDPRPLQEITRDANRHNTSLYVLDPRGFAPGRLGLDARTVRPFCPGEGNRAVQDTLRFLADETDGRAIVNTERLSDGLAQMMRDSSAYYLLAYVPARVHADGRFHEIDVRVKRRGAVVRGRKGYWALPTEATAVPGAPTAVAPAVLRALESLAAPTRDARPIRTWVGTARGSGSGTRVMIVWEPVALPTTAAGQPARVSVVAADARGAIVYRSPAGGRAGAERRFGFEAEHGPVEIRLLIEDADGRVLERDQRSVELAAATEAGMSTPRVFRARTARDVQALAADADPLPVVGREFSRSERLVVRFDSYGAGMPVARLLDRRGAPLRALAVTPAAAGGTHAIDLALNALVAGEYVLEIAVPAVPAATTELIAFRVRS